MTNQPEQLPQKEMDSLGPEESFAQDIISQKLLADISFAEVPDTLTFDIWLNQMSSELTSSVLENKKDKRRKFELLKKRLIKHYSDNQNPEDLIHLTHSPPDAATEFSLKLYLVNGQYIKGNVHKGKEGHIPHVLQRDEILDNQSVVNIHTHPSNLAFSREDIRTMLAEDPSVPKRCLNIALTPDYLFLTFPTTDSPRMDKDELIDFLGISRQPITDHDEIYNYNQELLVQLQLPETIDKDTRILGLSMLDALYFCNKVQSPLYVGKSGATTLTRIKSIDDIQGILNFVE